MADVPPPGGPENEPPGWGSPPPGSPPPPSGPPPGQVPPPGYGTPPPGTPPPGYGAPPPGYGAPGYGAQTPGYGAQTPGYGAPGWSPGPPAGVKPDNFLIPAILATLFCCLPGGIAAIVFASQVDGKWNRGDYLGAQQSAKNARTWTFISAGVGVAVIVLWLIIGLAAGSSDTNY